MAKKIRQIKLAEEDINKNSGKEISHTISKIKAHERLYTFLLVIVFMVTISVSVFLGLKVDSYVLYDPSYYLSSFSLSGQSVTLTSNNIMSDEEGLRSPQKTLDFSNNTNHKVNYIIRFAVDEDMFEKCDCKDKVVDYHMIKYSLDGKTVQTFTDETMIITAGMIKEKSDDYLNIKFWIDDSIEGEAYFYGKFIMEELEDMDS